MEFHSDMLIRFFNCNAVKFSKTRIKTGNGIFFIVLKVFQTKLMWNDPQSTLYISVCHFFLSLVCTATIGIIIN